MEHHQLTVLSTIDPPQHWTNAKETSNLPNFQETERNFTLKCLSKNKKH
jgi:hypothetical protein